MKNNSIGIEEIDSILKPRTPAERAATLALYAAKKGEFTAEELEELGRYEAWRTEMVEFRGHMFCAKCSQTAGADWCDECGESLPGFLPTILDFVVAPTHDLVWSVATALLKTELAPRSILKALHDCNQQSSTPMSSSRVDEIFGMAAAKELVRRKQGA